MSVTPLHSESAESIIPGMMVLQLDDIEAWPVKEVVQKLKNARASARKSLKRDVRNYLDANRNQQREALQLGWDVIVLSTVDDDDSTVKEELSAMRADYKSKGKTFPSDPALYRTTGPLQRIIAARAGLTCAVTKPYLKKHPHLLFLLQPSEFDQLASDYPGQKQLNEAFPRVGERQSKQETLHHGDELLVAANATLEKAAALVAIVKKAKRSKLPVAADLTDLAKRLDDVVKQLIEAADPEARPADFTPELPLFAETAA